MQGEETNYGDLRQELAQIRDALKDKDTRTLIKDIVREECLIAQDIAKEPQVAAIDIVSILMKVDHVVSRVWDWIRRRREK